MRRTGFILSIALVLACTACGQADSTADESGAGTETGFIGVLVFDGVLTSDVIAPLEVFGNAVKKSELEGYRVITVSPSRKTVTTEEGVVLHPNHSIADAPALEVLIVGSAYDMGPVLGNENLVDFVRAQGGNARWLGGNCSGVQLLGEAGLIGGRKVTTYPGGEAILKVKYPGANVEFGEYVVVDGNLVTSNGGLVSYRAALTLLERMTSREFADAVAEELYYDRLLEDER